MKTSNQITKEQLCKVALKKMMLEANKEVAFQMKSFPKTVKIELRRTTDDKLTILNRLLYFENNKYDKNIDIEAIKSVKAKFLQHIHETKEIYDNELNFNINGYEGQRQRIIDQLLVLRKIEYLEKLKSETQISKIQPTIEKIKWTRGVSEFGYMMLQLVEKNYIELPTRINADGSFERLARMLFQTFEVTDSWSSFKDALSIERNRLSETKRLKLIDFPTDFPESKELGPLKKK
jgi:hypothetical protein